MLIASGTISMGLALDPSLRYATSYRPLTFHPSSAPKPEYDLPMILPDHLARLPATTSRVKLPWWTASKASDQASIAVVPDHQRRKIESQRGMRTAGSSAICEIRPRRR